MNLQLHSCARVPSLAACVFVAGALAGCGVASVKAPSSPAAETAPATTAATAASARASAPAPAAAPDAAPTTAR